jgi:hypothetical protein
MSSKRESPSMKRSPSFSESQTIFIKFQALSLPNFRKSGKKRRKSLLRKMCLPHLSQLRHPRQKEHQQKVSKHPMQR